jgi:hypothetical protein
MGRSNKTKLQPNQVDLTSFLDIISILFAVQLLMLCILALSTGFSKVSQTSKQRAPKEVKPDFVITRADNESEVANATLLHCRDDRIDQYDGNTKQLVAKHVLPKYSAFKPANIAIFDYVYILVQPSCFDNLDRLLNDVKHWTFLKIGYEPLTDNHNIDWLK